MGVEGLVKFLDDCDGNGINLVIRMTRTWKRLMDASSCSCFIFQ